MNKSKQREVEARKQRGRSNGKTGDGVAQPTPALTGLSRPERESVERQLAVINAPKKGARGGAKKNGKKVRGANKQRRSSGYGY